MDRKHVEHTLNLIKEIKGSCIFYDVHCHPFEVMDGPINYVLSSRCNGLFSSVSAEYTAPALSDLDLKKQQKAPSCGHDKSILDKMLQLNRRRIYAHNGPKVFSDQMALSGIDRVVLLPVITDEQSANQQLQLLSDMFSDDERFLFGYCVPNDIPVNDIAEHIKQVVNQHSVVVLKIHPSFQGIDPSRSEGKGRIESILAASKEESLKVVVHGGLSPDCKNPDAVAYGTVGNLRHIDWSITPETVVLAHSCSYGYSPREVGMDVLPSLNKLLSRYVNLVVDTSALEVDSLSLIFRTTDIDRICFGSDALYENQWAEMVKMWSALQQSVTNPEASLLKVASFNPGKVFFEQDFVARISSGQIESITDYGEG